MRQTRRRFFERTLQLAAVAAVFKTAERPAYGCLWGKWRVRCPTDGEIDLVEDGTCQHRCSKDNTQVFSGNTVTVVCPNGHPNTVDSGRLMRELKCRVDGVECRVDAENIEKEKKQPPRQPDRGGNR